MPNLQRNCFHQMQFIPGPQRRAWSNWGCGWWLVVTNNTMALYSMKRYSMVWYGMVWYGVVISNLHLARVNFFRPLVWSPPPLLLHSFGRVLFQYIESLNHIGLRGSSVGLWVPSAIDKRPSVHYVLCIFFFSSLTGSWVPFQNRTEEPQSWDFESKSTDLTFQYYISRD